VRKDRKAVKEVEFRTERRFRRRRNRRAALDLADGVVEFLKTEGWEFHSMAVDWDSNLGGYWVEVTGQRWASRAKVSTR
jgi:hypothetical protein